MTQAYIGLGSNIGDREYYVRWAIEELRRLGETKVSSLYETDPVGTIAEGTFLNAVISVETLLSARELFTLLKELERKIGRVPRERWGPREIDLDLLLYGDAIIDEPDLKVPHPRMFERAFVLVPLLEVNPGAYEEPDDTAGVRFYSELR